MNATAWLILIGGLVSTGGVGYLTWILGSRSGRREQAQIERVKFEAAQQAYEARIAAVLADIEARQDTLFGDDEEFKTWFTELRQL